MRMKILLTFTLTLLVSLPSARAGLLDMLGFGKVATNAAAAAAISNAPLSQEQIAQGLKEALGKGVQQAVARLGHEGGFLTNANVKIPMPKQLRMAEASLRILKQDHLANEFVATMNHAAEQAVPAAAGAFGEAVQGMTMADAKAILAGTNNAATEYFRRTTETNLYAKFLPIVKKATDQAGVTSAYKQLVEKAGPTGSLGSFGRSRLGDEPADVDAYITSKALDGLYKMVAEEEKRIRENPAARTTELLQKVFGEVAK